MPHVGYFPKPYPKPLSIHATGFMPTLDTYDWEYADGRLSPRATLTEERFICPVCLPHGATINKITLYGYRTSADALLQATLTRWAHNGGTAVLGQVVADWTGGWGSGYDDTITEPVVDNDNYSYYIYAKMDPDAAVTEVGIGTVEILWT